MWYHRKSAWILTIALLPLLTGDPAAANSLPPVLPASPAKTMGVSADLSLAEQLQIATQQLRAADYRSAEKTLQRAIAQAREQGDRASEAQGLTQLSQVRVWMGKYQQGLETADVAIQRWQELGDVLGEAEVLTWKAEAQDGLDDRTSVSTIQQALAKFRQTPDPSSKNAPTVRRRQQIGEGTALLSLGAFLFKQDQAQKALETLKESQQKLQAADDRFTESLVITWIGWVQWNQNPQPEQLTTLEAGSQQSQATGNRASEFVAQFFIATTDFRQGNYSEAKRRYQQILPIVQTAGSQNSEAWTWLQIAKCDRALKQYDQAISAFQQALQIGRQADQTEQLIREALIALSVLYQVHTQQPQLAEKALQEAIAAFPAPDPKLSPMQRSQRQMVQKAIVLLAIGQDYGTVGERLRGLDLIRQALQLRQALTDPALEDLLKTQNVRLIYVNYIWATGQFFHRKGDYERAIAYHREAYAFAERMGEEFYDYTKANFQAEILRGIALAYFGQGKIAEAVAQEEQAIKRLEADTQPKNDYNIKLKKQILESLAVNYRVLGEQHREKREFKQAILKFQKAREIAKQIDYATGEILALLVTANVYRDLQEYRKALPFVEEARAIAQRSQEESLGNTATLTQARIHQQLADYPQALALFNQVLQYAQTSQDGVHAARIQGEIGSIYLDQGQVRLAVDRYEKALQTYRQAQTLYQVPLTTANFETVCAQPEQFAESGSLRLLKNGCNQSNRNLRGSQSQVESLQRNRSHSAKLLKESEATVLNALAIALQDLGEYDRALQANQTALEITRSFDDPATEALYQNNLGVLYARIGDYPKAAVNYEKALKLATQLGDRNVMAVSLAQLGSLYQTRGNYAKALESMLRALELTRALEDKTSEALRLNNLGGIYQEMGNYAQAEQAFQQALTLQRSLGLKGLESTTLGNLAELAQKEGKDEQALQLHQQSLQLAQEIGNASKEATARFGIAGVYSSQAQYAKAFAEYEQSLKVIRRTGEKESEANLLAAMGGLHESLGQYGQAEQTYRQALQLALQMETPVLATAIERRIADALWWQNKYKEALAIYDRTLAKSQAINNPVGTLNSWYGIAGSYRQLKQFEPAKAAYEKGLEIARRLELPASQANLLSGLGQVYLLQNQPEQAEIALRQALTFAQVIHKPETTAKILHRFGDLYRQQQKPQVAIAFYKQSVQQYEEIRQNIRSLPREQQQAYTDTIAETYRSLADVLIAEARLAEAAQVLERLKLQEIKDYAPPTRSQAQNKPLLLNTVEQEVINKHGTLIAFGQKLQGCDGQTTDTCSQLRKEQRNLTRAFNEFADSLTPQIQKRCLDNNDVNCIQPNDQFTTAAKKLIEAQPNTLIVSPLVLEDKVWILVASQGGVLSRYESKVDRNTLGNKVLELRYYLQDRNSDPAKLQAASKQLYDWLIKPIEPALKASQKTQNLVFALDRVTRYIPMAVLYDGQRYLVQRYTISTVLSLETTKLQKSTIGNVVNSPVLALGLSQATTDYAALPNVESELDAIVQTTGIYPGRKFLNQQFTLDAIADHLDRHKILHLATHGQFVPNQKNGSYLVLGNGEKMPIADIRTLDFGDIELVVLSACETALGSPEQEGVEIPGLSSFFLSKGAGAVMASLWAVDDSSTALMMQQFYQHLASGKMTKAQALQKVQQDLITGKLTFNDIPRSAKTPVPSKPAIGRSATPSQPTPSSFYAHPYYWAPFILIGNGIY
ncbi:MAG: tetratricopeptide repeat protein [Synechococcales bacterium]|nr:tetratricopeptide repeat protein [Synechococcales bacterium]